MVAMDAPDIMEEDCGNTFSALETVVVVAVATLLASSTTGWDTALMLSAGVDVAGRQGLSPLLLLLLLFLHLLLLLHLLILLLRLHLHLQDGGAACRRGCVPDRALLHK
jgi:hypothetical protein